jgi:hypothetical protein
MIDGLPTYMANNAIFALAERYLGLPVGELDDVYGYVSSGMANARGIALDETIKIVDAIAGQGILIQPDCRLGFEAFYTKGNVFLVKNGFVLPSLTMKLLAPASRLKPTVVLSANGGTSAPTATITLGGLRTLAAGKSAYFYSTSAAVKLTVAAFDTAYTAATKKALISTTGAGVSLTTTGVTGNTLYVKVIDDLGNATIVKSTETFTIA